MSPARLLTLPLAMLLLPACNLRFEETWPESGARRLAGRTETREGERRSIGHWTFWYQDGVNKQAQGFFDGGPYPIAGATAFGGTRIPFEGRTKKWYFWDPEGTLLCEGLFKEGQRDDLWACWREDGQLCCTGFFLDGRPSGFHVTWIDGVRRDEHYYEDGVLSGPRVVRDARGRPVWRGTYAAGELVDSDPPGVEAPPLHVLLRCAEAAEEARRPPDAGRGEGGGLPPDRTATPGE